MQVESMIASKSLLVVSTVFAAAVAGAATVDMSDPRRAVGLENDVRIDAQLSSEYVSSHSPIRITYQIQNLSPDAVALAYKACEASYDSDSRTITIAIGQEVPKNGEMPDLVMIGSGQSKVFAAGTVAKLTIPELGSAFSIVPRFVQIRVNILRDLSPFLPLMRRQEGARAAIVLTDEQFDQWLDRNESIFLNAIPVRYRAAATSRVGDASRR